MHGETEVVNDARVVYAVLAHRDPPQVHRLVSLLLEHPQSAVLLHYDGDIAGVDARVGRIPRRSIGWGRMSIPRLFLDTLRQSVSVPGAEWIVILSGQDYPLRPLARIHTELLASPYDVHMDTRLVTQGDPWPLWEPLTRYGYQYLFTPRVGAARIPWRLWQVIHRHCDEVQARSERALTEQPSVLQPWEVLPRFVLRNVGHQLAFGRRSGANPFRQGKALWAGDAWFMVRRAAAVQILEAVDRERAYVRYLSRTIVPDEVFFQTLVANWLPHLRIGPQRRYRVFLPGEWHPHVWRRDELPALLETGADFARKFDLDVDAGILDDLDALVRG